jgi:C-terminal processing protease CtpA/Prc
MGTDTVVNTSRKCGTSSPNVIGKHITKSQKRNKMKKLAITLITTFLLLSCTNSQTVQPLNLDFEQSEKGYPTKWEDFGSKDYKIYIDSTNAKSGKFSAVIENLEYDLNFKALSINLPNNYNGKFIRLSGYIKTENVTDGYAGLWMRIDPQVGFDNMGNRGVTGTTNWAAYEITLPLDPKKTDKIVVGGLLVGKGKMWLDNLHVSIDGKDLNDANIGIYKKETRPAEKDTAFASGSNIVFPDLNNKTINDLELLGRVWGFLKYHHPEISKGNYNWDYELFRILPGYLIVRDNQERDNMLITWIKKYGQVPVCKNCKPTPNDAAVKPELSWMDNSNLSNELKTKLKEIYDNRNQGENYYIALHEDAGNPNFTNENPYSKMPYPDDGFRLLSLYRYWNMIEYFYPNKHLTDKKWSTVLKEYIPKFLDAKNKLEYELAAVQVIGELHDSHANLWGGADKISALRGTNFAPFRAEFIENKLVVTDYYNPEFSADAKLKIGDIITHINGKAIASIIDSVKTYYPASNNASMLRDISADLLRSKENTMNLGYISESQHKEQNIALYAKGKLNMYDWYKVNKNEKCFKLLEGNIGYVTLANIKESDIPEIKESFKNTKGLIIDIRNYPSTFVPFALGSYFVSRATAFVKFTNGDPANPGAFTYTEPLEITGDGDHYKGKLIVLVNEKSQSQAEYTALAFRAAENSKIVGSTTAGADGNVSAILLPGGLRTMISGIGVYYPDGKETQRIGIVPDIKVTPTIEGIKKGKDELLEKAIEIINQ